VRAPAALLAIPLLIGAACGLLLVDRAPASLAVVAASAALIALISAAASFADDLAPDCTCCIVAGTLLAGLSLGHASGVRAYHPPLLAWFLSSEAHRSTPVVLTGVLREDAAAMPTGVSLTVDVRQLEGSGDDRPRGTAGGVRLSVAGAIAGQRLTEWRAGRTVRIAATLREATVYRNPGVPDERRALARRSIALVGSVKSGALVEVVARGGPIAELSSAVRAWVRAIVATTVGRWSERSAGVAAAITIGDRTGLTQDDERRLQEAGTYHVIAISGGNIAILTLLLMVMMATVGVPPRTAAALTIAGLLTYGQVAGASASVARAIAAAVVYLAARILDHRGPTLNVLAVTAVLGVTAAPAAVFDPGFVLSFGATLGILIGVPRMLAWASGNRSRIRRVLAPAIAVFAATIAAEAVLVPVSAAIFGRVTFAGLLLNFAAIPLMTVVQVGTLGALALALLDIESARLAGYIVHVAARGLVDSAGLVDAASWLAREVAAPAWWVVVAYYSGVVAALAPSRLRAPSVAVATISGIAIVAGPHWAARDAVALHGRSTLRVAFLDVGQGDSTLVLLPSRRAILVDAGGLPVAPLQDPADGPAFDIGERVVSRAARAFGVRSLDTFVFTHGDPDHIGGARSIVRSFRPRAIWEGVPVPVHAPLQTLATLTTGTRAEWRNVQAGDRLRLDGVDVRVLHPPLPEWERQRVRNEDSVVLSIRFGDVSILLPGDIGREGEPRTLDHFERTRVVILKAPHHGSATSSTMPFLQALRPQAVIFSAGRHNRFGHPARDVVARYRALGVHMFVTHEDGAVILDTDGRDVTIRGWHSSRRWTSTRADGLSR
jgi:competence protein ComEC